MKSIFYHPYQKAADQWFEQGQPVCIGPGHYDIPSRKDGLNKY